MAINVDDYGGHGVAASLRQRLQTDARQVRWMYELEHAMLQGGKKPAQEAGGAAPAREPSRQPLSAAPPTPAGQATAKAEQAKVAAGGADVGTAAQDDTAEPVAPPVVAAAAPLAAAEPAAQQAVAGAAGAAVGAARANPSALPSTMSVVQVYAAAGASPGLGLTRTASGDAAPSQTAANAPVKTAAAGALLSLVRAAPAASPASEGAVDAGAEAAPAHDQPAAQDSEEYAARLLHIYRDGADVQAWVRDSGIGPQQVQALARSMACSLADTGAQLAALTVNGRRVPVPGRIGARQGDASDSQPAPAQDNFNATGVV